MNDTPDRCTDDYDRVVREFCERMDLHDPDAVAQGGTIDIGGVHLSMALNQVVPQAPVVSIYVDVGLSPRVGQASVLRVLLEQNFAHSAERGLAYCISPSTGHVLGVIHVGLGGLAGQGLEALVNMLVDSALEFRVLHFQHAPSTKADDELDGRAAGADA